MSRKVPVKRADETGEFRYVGFYREYPPALVDEQGRYLGPAFDDDLIGECSNGEESAEWSI